MLRKAVVTLIATLCASGTALAQAGSISGTVVGAENGQPIPGVQVRVMGTALGALTREDGRYTIATVQPGTYTVRATRIGFSPDSVTGVTVSSGGTATADLRLRSSAAILTGMVVIGYGEAEARDVTGSVGVVSSEEFNQGRVVSPQELIQSKVAGVQVMDNNEPGGGLAIRVRGASSVTASSDPLYVVDGMPMQTGGGISTDPKRNPLSFINPQDIESITVLKDASAAAIYGSRASNGVVIIRTKSGAEGRRIDFTSTLSTARVSGGPDLIGAEQFRELIADRAPSKLTTIGDANTDWREAIERDGVGREQNLAVGGGRDDMNYRLSLNYLDQSGVIEGTGLRRASTALSYQDRFFDRFDVRANIKGSRQDDSFTPSSVIGDATGLAPTQPLFDENGDFFQWENTLEPGNPLATLAAVEDRGTTWRSVGNLETKYEFPFLQGLSGTLNLGYDFASSSHTTFSPSGLRGSGGSFNRWNPSGINTLLDLYGNYNRAFDQFRSRIDLTGGYSYEESRNDTPFISASGLGSNLLGPNGVPSATLVAPSLSIEDSRLISFFGRANWTLMDKYLATLSLRRDGSSKFGPDNQWGVFPAAAFAWRLSEEPFMQGRGPFNDLKVRVSWGVTGNQGFGNYLAIPAYTIGDAGASALFGNEYVTTIRPSAVDPGLKWEQTTSNNFGLDFGLFENRLAGTIDYYRKKTKDLIFRVPVAGGTNVADFVTTNIGSMQNNGFELGLNAQVLGNGWRGFTWTASFNAATNSNKLLTIDQGGTDRIEVGGISGGVGNRIQIFEPGLPLNSFFVYKQKYDEDGKPIFSTRLLDMYEDLNGDTIINTADRRAYKSPAPKWILGHTSNIGYGNFDLGFTLRAHLGNYVYNNVASNLGHFQRITGSTTGSLHESVLETGFESPQYFSDYYVEDASFLRMDNITLGYTFHNLRQVQALRVFGTIQSAFTITGYSGVDPSAAYVDGLNGVAQGIDNNIYPRSRTFLTGANIRF